MYLRVSPSTLGAIVLAGGRSKRMGRPKYLMDWGGCSIIQRVVQVLVSAGVRHIFVVTGAWHNELVQSLKSYPVQIVHNLEWETGGMLSSVKKGVAALPDDLQGVIISLGDHPAVSTGTIDRLVKAFFLEKSRIILPVYRKKTGHPIVIHKALWKEIGELDPAIGLRSLMQKHAAEVARVEVETEEILVDINTFGEYKKATSTFLDKSDRTPI